MMMMNVREKRDVESFGFSYVGSVFYAHLLCNIVLRLKINSYY